MTEQEANERIALQLGWHPDSVSNGWVTPDRSGWQREPPDFSQWDRFEELKSFARERFSDNELPIILAVNSRLQGDAVLYLEPWMLRDALLELLDGDQGSERDARSAPVVESES